MEILSKEACIKIDKEAIEDFGIPAIVLMENAGERIKNEICNEGNNFIIFSGTGNNGGDALVVARKLYLDNKNVSVYILGNKDKGTEEFKINLSIIEKLNVNIVDIESKNDILNLESEIYNDTVLIDGIFGVGLNREVKGIYSEIIKIINKNENVISIDIPSGMDANTGRALGICVKARKTCTIEHLKRGFIYNEAILNIGKIVIIKIDIPNVIKEKNTEKVYVLEKTDYIDKIPKRNKINHKGNFGKVGIVGGSREYVGAVYIVSEAAVRTGSGLVTMIVKNDISEILKSKTIEAMVREYDSTYEISGLEKFDVIACGPGMGDTKESEKVLRQVLNNTSGSIVIDADGLNILSKNEDLYDCIKGRAILTPHLGEMSRLTGISVENIEKDKIEIARKFAKDKEVILLLKGYNTIISDGEMVIVNKTGSSKMASGGMGDCLTGIITSLVGQGLSKMDGALLGAYIHGYTGDLVGKRLYSVSAREIIKTLPKIIEELLCEK